MSKYCCFCSAAIECGRSCSDACDAAYVAHGGKTRFQVHLDALCRCAEKLTGVKHEWVAGEEENTLILRPTSDQAPEGMLR